MDVLPRQTADAVANMAADYLLLEHYPRPDRIRFRPFAWSEPAYTFGVSQPWAKYRAQVPAHYPLIRRCTGGGLVSHLDDWTFALVIPAGHPLYAADAMASTSSALRHAHGGPWEVFRREDFAGEDGVKAERYALAGAFDAEPGAEAITSCFRRAR